MASSVIIAALDEGPAIEAVVRGCLRQPGVDEVVVVDDGSTDNTAAKARAGGARVFRNARPHGKGAALRRAALHAREEILITLDGDGQDDPADIPRLLEGLRDDIDLVIGARFGGRMLPGAMTPRHRLGNLGLTAAFNLLYGARLSDTQAGFRAIRRALWERLPLRAERYEIETEVLVLALRAGAGVAEVPVTRRARRYGHSALHDVRDGGRILACMLRRRLR